MTHAARRSMLLMVAFVGLWAVVEAVAAPVFAHVPPFEIVWARYATHLCLMLLVWGWRDPARLWRTNRMGYQLARSLLMLGMPASWIIANRQGVAPGTLMSVFWLSPLMVLALSPVMLGERVRRGYWVATLLACAGAVYASGPATFQTRSDLVFPAGMAATFGLYVVMTRSLRSDTVHANLFYTALGVFVPLSFLMPFVWVTPSPNDVLALVAVGTLGFFALWALDRSVGSSPLSVSAAFIYVQLPITIGLAVGLGHFHPGPRIILGIGLVALVALYLFVREPTDAVCATTRANVER